MIEASVTQTRNRLSGLLTEVRRGETVLIMHRGRPVAQITRYPAAELTGDEAADELIRRGLAEPPEKPFDVDRFLAMPRPRVPAGLNLSEAIIEEREAGR